MSGSSLTRKSYFDRQGNGRLGIRIDKDGGCELGGHSSIHMMSIDEFEWRSLSARQQEELWRTIERSALAT